MTLAETRDLLERLRRGETTVDAVVRALQAAPFADLGFARVDTHRAVRQGFPEVVYGAGKTPEQVAAIAARVFAAHRRVLVTRTTLEQVRAVRRRFRRAVHHPVARCLTLEQAPLPRRPGYIAVLCAGTSDLPVAEEAVVTAEFMGNRVERLYDVGVAGMHRVLARAEVFVGANVAVVVAGMEGALPSIVGGMVECPVIAVPTSVGYGASLGGMAALLGMLNSCAMGVAVVNIDNGFGAGYFANLINKAAVRGGGG